MRNPSPRASARPTSWTRSLIAAAAAASVALALMFLARALYEIRTLPERVMEWALLFIPPSTFEAVLGQFGAQAKVYALYATVAGLFAILTAIGALTVRYVRSPLMLAASGPLLYLVAMGLIVPLTGGGSFGASLPQDRWLVNACYLVIALVYGSLLLAGHLWHRGEPGIPQGAQTRVGASDVTPPTVRSSSVGRRAMVASGLATVLTAAFAAWRGRYGGAGADLPLAQIDSLPARTSTPAPPVQAPALAANPPQAIGSPTQAPTAAVAVATPPTQAPAQAASALPPPVATVAPTSTPGLPGPSAKAFLKQAPRGEGGALTAGAREPGTLSDLITPTERFYHVTKNAVSDPMIQPERWRLAIDGDVERPVQLDYRTLLQIPSVEVIKTLECISNFTAQCELPPFGCELISTAIWRGVRLGDIIELAGGAKAGATGVTLIASDEFTSAIPLEVALDPETILAYEMNGQPLPYEHGYPARVLSSGRYGYKSAKWITGIRVSSPPPLDWYGQRNWNKDGLVKTMSRIDLPAPGARVPAGPQRIAGIAYGGDRGVAAVEVSTDNGQTWRPTVFLEPAPGKDTWVRWETSTDVPAGATVRIFSRAMDGTGQYQAPDFVLPAPDGASGYNSIQVTGQ